MSLLPETEANEGPCIGQVCWCFDPGDPQVTWAFLRGPENEAEKRRVLKIPPQCSISYATGCMMGGMAAKLRYQTAAREGKDTP